MKRQEVDDVDALRGLYRFLRRHPSAITRGRAWLLWQRYHGPSPTRFLVDSHGEAVALPSSRAALIAELRLVLLRAGYPEGFVATWDRTDN